MGCRENPKLVTPENPRERKQQRENHRRKGRLSRPRRPAAYALEKLIDALDAAQQLGVPRKAMPRVQALIERASGLLNNLELKPERDAA